VLWVGLKAELFNRAYSIISSFDSLLKEGSDTTSLVILYCNDAFAAGVVEGFW